MILFRDPFCPVVLNSVRGSNFKVLEYRSFLSTLKTPSEGDRLGAKKVLSRWGPYHPFIMTSRLTGECKSKISTYRVRSYLYGSQFSGDGVKS